MKRTVLFLIILFIVGFVSQAQENPFKQYGVKGEILTLSKGKYKEVFYNEEIMQIGTVKINTLTDKVVELLEPDTTEFAYRAEITSRFISVDPLCEEYYSWSPYVYVGNNPIKRIDPTGMDWYEDKDGTYQYDPKLNQKNQAQILQKGQSYVGATAQVNDSKGNAFATFRKDGSIMFANEGAAYARMTSNTKKTGEEEMAALTTEGTLVLPSYKNKSGEVDIFDYNYSAKNGNIVDASGKEYNTVALAHTHPSGGGPTGDDGDGRFMAKYFPNKPNYVFMMKQGGDPGISFIISNGTIPFSYTKGGYYNYMSRIAPYMNYKNITSGKYSLRDFTKQNIRAFKSLIP